MLFGISSAQATDGEASRRGVGGPALARSGDEPVDVDKRRLDESRVVARPPLHQLRGVHDLHLSAPPLRQLPELSATFFGVPGIVDENNPPRIGVADPGPDGEKGSYENEGTAFRELESLGYNPFYRVSL